MTHYSHVYHFHDHFHGEHPGECIIEIIKDLVSRRVFVHWIFSRQSNAAQYDDQHNDEIEVWKIDYEMSGSTNTEKTWQLFVA